MKNSKKIINEFKEANDEMNELEKGIGEELKEYKNNLDINKINFNDKKPIVQKIVFFLAGASNFIIGFALYFILKDKYKWQTDYIEMGAAFGLVASLVGAVLELITHILA